MKRKIVLDDKKERVVVRVCEICGIVHNIKVTCPFCKDKVKIEKTCETCSHFYPEVHSDGIIRYCLLDGFWIDADDHINSFPDNDCADYVFLP